MSDRVGERVRAARALANNPMAEALPDSKPFGGDPAADLLRGLRGKTIGGRPAEEVVTPDNAHLVAGHHTDEEIARRNAGKAESAARVVRSELDGKIRERGEFRSESTEPWMAPDPLREVAEAHTPPGMRPKFLSKRKVDRDGGTTRGYEIPKVDGRPVQVGDLVLGYIPEDMAARRNEHYRQKAERQSLQVLEDLRDRTGGRARAMDGHGPEPAKNILSDRGTNG